MMTHSHMYGCPGQIRWTVLTAVILGLFGTMVAGCGGVVDKPNIILFYIDDLGWSDVGFMGSRYYETPHIDRLASQGMIFTSAYANAPNCAPSRACLMSGQYTPRHGIYTVNNSDRGESKDRKLIPIPTETVLDVSIVTIAEALQTAGYVNASMGKWHLGAGPDGGPLSQGFDVNIGGNKVRLVSAIQYNTQRIYNRRVLTHSEYDHGSWKE